jgi:uncharacterized protein (DUF885 family)
MTESIKPEPVAPPPSKAEMAKFNAVEKEFYNTWVQRNPVFATRLGIHKYDAIMPDGTLAKDQDDHRLLKRTIARVEAVDGTRLPPARAVDRDLLLRALRLRLFEKETLRFWESIPEAPAVIGEAYFQVLVSEHASIQDRLRAITERMEKTPKYIEATRAKLTKPVKVWIDTELETLARLPSFFDSIKQSGRINLIVREYDRLCRAIDALQNALEEYSNWIIIDVLPRCRKEFAPGPEAFARLLTLRGIGSTPESVLAFGWRQFKWHEMTLRRLAHKVQRGAGVDEVREKIRASHPNAFAEVLNAVRDAVKRAKDVVVRSGFATLPPAEELRVTETPVFLRHRMPFGAYYPPARFDPKQVGLYFVTPGEVERDLLKEHNLAALANMSVHEGYPGHHLQLVCANRHPSLSRIFAFGVETVEGWAHYCEEEMKRLGFDTSLESRFAQTQDMLWRAARVILDVRLATGRIGFEDAVRFLMDATGMERAAATAEARRYTQTPGTPLSYLWGKEKIKELKQSCRKRMAKYFSERFFHDAILYSGSLPLDLLTREMEWKMAEEIHRLKTAPPPPPEKTGKDKKAAGHDKAAHAGKAAPVKPGAAAPPAKGAPAKPPAAAKPGAPAVAKPVRPADPARTKPPLKPQPRPALKAKTKPVSRAKAKTKPAKRRSAPARRLRPAPRKGASKRKR